ncbi:NUDIX domain-containing protein [Salinihabitans flavidus]|uniref:NUDIX domain-containing protein n=1 Tax=Salinihabitans flavidus TaxID=569882 RepID=A0A1H8VV84_9RHOB|nr:NUDIX hydrolase [Salinihabitans flavidus]SEP19275.1 NUDIX domain-containing protein [Salinihabitans flavidus]
MTSQNAPCPRLATRAVILHDNRLLLVNAYPARRGDLWCAPGGGVVRGTSLPENLAREVHEETGLTIRVGAPCLVNEFHDPEGTFHQVDIYFRAAITAGTLSPDWHDPEGIVTDRLFVTREQMEGMRFKPDSLPHVAWGRGFGYDPLEPIVR